MTTDDTRLAALKATKLAVLVSALSGVAPDDLVVPDRSSTIVGCLADDRAWVLADRVGDLGPALHWFRRQAVAGLTILSEPHVAADLARRAAGLHADIEVKRVTGSEASTAEPAPPPSPPELADEIWRAAAVMADAGIAVVDDHGRLTGEVNGLEVARVEPPSPTDPLSEVTLSVGVGQADRQLHGYVHGHLDQLESLRRAVATVSEIRRAGAGLHPLTRLARPRWLRSVLVAEPIRAGLSGLQPQPPLRPNPGVFDTEPAAAYSAAERVTVVCSAGVDLDLIPEAVDYRLRIDPGSRLLLVLPPQDVKLATRGVIDLVPEAQVLALEPPW